MCHTCQNVMSACIVRVEESRVVLVRIVVADDHEIVRRGLRSLLEAQPGWEVVAEASSGREACERVRELQPNVAVLDVGMPEMNGLEATRNIARNQSTNPGADSDHARDRADGARRPGRGRPRLCAEKRRGPRPGFGGGSAAASTGRSSPRRFPTCCFRHICRERKARGEAAQRSRLTAREREIVQLLAEGKSNKEVAASLNISVKTAETHRTNIMNKLDLHSIGELVRYAVRNNIVEP